MSLDVGLFMDVDTGGKEKEFFDLFDLNITHNLGEMAAKAGIYECLWRPEEIGCKYAKDIIEKLNDGLILLKSNRERFEKYNPENGWGDYDGLVEFVSEYLDACKKHPKSIISISR